MRPDRPEIKGIVLCDVPMKRYTSMKVGGPVRYLIYPADEADLLKAVRILKNEGIKYRFIGNGTNIIVHDNGYDAAIIRITKMRCLRHKKTDDGAVLNVSGGTSLKLFIKGCALQGLTGLEKLYWIPGTVGGGIKMNAGSFGANISDVLERITVLDDNGDITSIEKKDLPFEYRSSPVKAGECVINAVFRLKTGSRQKILEDMEYVFVERRKRHPMEFPSSGSVFKGIDGEPAWQYVEKAGLRGLRIGDACVSEKHTNFIVNLGHAKAEDIKKLIDKIKKEVFEKLGVLLEEEVELWGFE